MSSCTRDRHGARAGPRAAWLARPGEQFNALLSTMGTCWRAADFPSQEPNARWQRLFYPMLTQNSAADCGLKHVVAFFCPWECYGGCQDAAAIEWMAKFVDIARQLKNEAARGTKLFFEVCAEWGNSTRQRFSQPREPKRGNTRAWKHEACATRCQSTASSCTAQSDSGGSAEVSTRVNSA